MYEVSVNSYRVVFLLSRLNYSPAAFGEDGVAVALAGPNVNHWNLVPDT